MATFGCRTIASTLALMIAPQRPCQSAPLSQGGLLGPRFYEAIDFTPARARGQRSVVIRSFMVTRDSFCRCYLLPGPCSGASSPTVVAPRSCCYRNASQGGPFTRMTVRHESRRGPEGAKRRCA